MNRVGSEQRFVILGNPENRRVLLFQEALLRNGLPPAKSISWQDFLSGDANLSKHMESGSLLRIESPGENFEVEKLLLAAGADEEDPEENSNRISKTAARSLTLDRGRIQHSRQWYLGFRAALHTIEQQLGSCPDHQIMNAPADIARMFDKRLCHAHLAANDVPVPFALPPVHNFDELIQAMRDAGIGQVFVKPAHGSSASGVVAFAINGNRMMAHTSVEMAQNERELRLYNSLRIKRYDSIKDIKPLINALCLERVHVEQWLPKAGLNGQLCDLRVVVIGGSSRHVVVRCSNSPMTNLHLGNQRGDLSEFKRRLVPGAWDASMLSCERALACFSGSHYAGVDLLISNDLKKHAVLEMNAFGDLLPNVLHAGLNTYETELLTHARRTELSPA